MLLILSVLSHTCWHSPLLCYGSSALVVSALVVSIRFGGWRVEALKFIRELGGDRPHTVSSTTTTNQPYIGCTLKTAQPTPQPTNTGCTDPQPSAPILGAQHHHSFEGSTREQSHFLHNSKLSTIGFLFLSCCAASAAPYAGVYKIVHILQLEANLIVLQTQLHKIFVAQRDQFSQNIIE